MNLKLLFALFVAVILVGAVVADAKGGSGGRSSFGGKSFGASKSSGIGLKGVPAAGHVSPIPASYTKRQKTGSNFIFPMMAGWWMGRSMHNQSPDDDWAEQSPGIPAILAIGGLLAVWRMMRGKRAA